jgi:pimeloyl-ACP methyl ester carboxylesterase
MIIMKKTLGCLLGLVLLASTQIHCSHDSAARPSKTFVLVHGAWQAPYVWDKVEQLLNAAGHKVVKVELPAHGNDTTAPQNVSVDVYRDKVIAAINGMHGRVLLVGHSMGGMVVAAVAEKMRERIEKLVFVGAFVPANGQALLDLALQDAQSSLGASLIPSADQLTLDVKRDSIVPVFCHDAPLAAQQELLKRFRVEPAIPFTNKVTVTAANFGKVEKCYVHTLQDRAVGINLQRAMASAANINKTYSVNSGHSPFLSKPEELANILHQIAD